MNTPPFRKRTAASARFSTYYKVQWYDDASLCWRDVQHQYPTRDAAEADYKEGRLCRTMEVTPNGRRPL